jgi:HSP20 family protein
VVRVEVPGLSKEDIELTFTKDALTVKGSIQRDAQIKDEEYYLSERISGAFSRTISLPFEVESEQAKAALQNGVLEIVVPKKEEARPKEIRIEVK